MKRLRWYWCLSVPMALVAGECEDTNVYITEVAQATSRTLIAKSDHCSYATLTITAKLDNLISSQRFPITVDLNGSNSVVLTTLTLDQPGRNWDYHYNFTWRAGGRSKVTSNNFVYTLPYHDGQHPVMQGYQGGLSHQRGTQDEYALDFGMPTGTPVCAARAGTVVALRQDSDSTGTTEKYAACANYVVIKHDDGTFAEYYHLKKNSVIVELSKTVVAGQQLAQSGNTGYSNGPHLHFAVFRNIDGKTRLTFPVQFKVHDDPITLREGVSY